MKAWQITAGAALILGGCHLLAPYEPTGQDAGPQPHDAAGDLDAGPRPDRAGDMPHHDLPRSDAAKPDAKVPPTQGICSKDKWCWMAPYPQGNNLRGVWRLAKNSVLAVGDHGTIMHYDGKTWQAMASNTSLDLYDVWGTSGSNVYAVGTSSTILRFNGKAWNVENSPHSATTYTAIHGTGATDIMAMSASNKVIRWNGKKWDGGAIPHSAKYYGVWRTTNRAFVGGSEVLAVWNKGWGSQKIKGVTFRGVWGNGAGDVFAVGNGAIYKIGGGKWIKNNVIPESLNAVRGSGAGHAFAVGKAGAVRRHDGKAWGSEDSGTDRDLYGVWVAPNKVAYAVGHGGVILYRRP